MGRWVDDLRLVRGGVGDGGDHLGCGVCDVFVLPMVAAGDRSRRTG